MWLFFTKFAGKNIRNMANFEKIDIRDMEQLTNVEFVGYADNDVVIIDDLRNFSKLQAIKVDFLLIIVIKQGRVAMRTNKEEATASSNDIIIFMIVGYCGSKLEEWGVFDFYTHLNHDNPGTSICLAIFWSVVFLALAAFCLWASYKLFTRMQVICNKWINI